MALPTGTVTFLFTDIEGSTKLWEAHPGAMQTALATHDALLRRAIEAHDGYVFKTIGDAFCAAFATAPRGLEAALAAQLALLAEPWPEPLALKVRMALHTGDVESRDHTVLLWCGGIRRKRGCRAGSLRIRQSRFNNLIGDPCASD